MISLALTDRERALFYLGSALQQAEYRFTTVTPTTQRSVLQRRESHSAGNLRDVFGWNLPFEPRVIGDHLFGLLQGAEACVPTGKPQLWRSTLRFSTLDGLLFAHSGYPTNAADSVFFGPDSHRFVSAIQRAAPAARRIVDVGCGAGVGGIALAHAQHGRAQLTLADISPQALSFARVNAALAGLEAEIVHSDVLAGVQGNVDLVIANPPYLVDAEQRVYRDGGGELGAALALRIIDEALERLAKAPEGGTLLLYSGSAIVDGVDRLRQDALAKLSRGNITAHYEELDPDVFSDELGRPAYARVERIAAVFLEARVAPHSARFEGTDTF